MHCQKLGLENGTWAANHYQLWFRQDGFNLAFVVNLNFIFSNGHLYRAQQTMNSLPSQILNR